MEVLTLVQQAKQGDRHAFCTLYGLFKDRLYRYAFYRLGNAEDAEDAVSECVLALWKQLPSLREPAAFSSWAFRILGASCAKQIRTQMTRRSQENVDDPLLAGDQALVRSDRTDTHLILREALQVLSEEEREIVLLSAVSGLKSEEIAAITGLTAGAVRSKLSRSLKKLRQHLDA